MESQNSILKKHIPLKIALPILFIFVLILGLVLYTVLSALNKPTTNNNQEEVVSAPVKTPEEVPLAKEIKFKNSYIELVSTSNQLYSDCGVGTKVSFNPDMELNYYRNNKSGSEYASVSLNVNRYRNQNDTILNRYDYLDKLLNDEYTTDEIKDTNNLMKLFGVPCSGEAAIPVVYLSKVNYPGTESAYVILTYGSSQSVVKANSPIVDVSIYAKVKDSYLSISKSPNYSNRIDFLLNQDELIQCEFTDPNVGDSYIKIFDESGSKCVRDVYKEQLDKPAFDAYVQTMLNDFALDF